MTDTVEQEKVDNVNHPTHYVNHPSGVEAINITREFSFVLGNAWKYLMRFRYKGRPKEDLDKAVWYMNDYLYNGYNKNEAAFTLAKSVEKTDEIIKNARKVIAAETVPEVKHAMRSILEHALFGTDVACNFCKAKVELEEQTDKIAKSLLLGDDFDVQSANIILDADKLLADMEDCEARHKQEIAEYEAEKAKESEEKAKAYEAEKDAQWETQCEAVFNGLPVVNCESVVQVTVNDTTHEVVPNSVELNPKMQYHTESVMIPMQLANFSSAKKQEWAENYLRNDLAMKFPKPEPFVEVKEEQKVEKKRRKKKTSV